ncbi:GIN domain-containing protein [Aquirufa antheringensis]|uniref:GIN domain-containing protein n=1 Tax=Aquirufa antheringensis TaxID=2516559 RepID=UPI00208FC58D|nr:DUF2807 domain-containing protein [Aquirufa antheringensis]USQ03042.1 hypothetical protein G9X63_02600 [Aquirufa antheringensis]
MKQIKLLLALFLAVTTASLGQSDPFTGSEKSTKTLYDFSNFSKISLLDIDGNTEIAVGDSFKIEINMREKYLPILFVTEKNNELQIKFNYTRENNKYIFDPRIRIKITCPKLTEVYKQGNSSVGVRLQNQSSFFLSNEGNGSATLKGKVGDLKIKNDGNGKTDASKLVAKNVMVDSYGNGNVLINAIEKATGRRNGNGLILQKGEAILKLN